MISIADLLETASECLTEAEILLNAHQYDGAVYLCGYAIEIALKCRICKTLNWVGFPSSSKEFENYKSLKTHDLDVLLSFTSIEQTSKMSHISEWSTLSIWNPEARYNPKGWVSPAKARIMLDSVKILIGFL